MSNIIQDFKKRFEDDLEWNSNVLRSHGHCSQVECEDIIRWLENKLKINNKI